ncbi:SH3 domain-containing protein [Ramlibacter sp. Leaf400]|uniref:SH3 domain-containing protein n=1 Tax=Ramlibacter sp. Leaf400 TaxID=1736365 RepID=UPI0007020441|nr:SH3 domain-containing protein [Ramlibacter sp. Leaf400]KQT14281.1 hypothetical protein ASG30_01475 [Ramlibacter sp. Leaf400]
MSTQLGRAAVALAWLMACGVVLAQPQEETVVVKQATELREQPGASRSLAALQADSSVTRMADRQGPWVRVRTTAGLVGWVHLFDLGTPGSAAASSGGASGLLRGVTGLFGKPSPTTVSTSAVGIRGLGAQDLAQAQPDTAAVTRMEALRATEPQARQFARDAGLAPQSVDPLPAPPRPASANPGAQQ